MRWILIWLLVLSFPSPSWAAKRITVAQLEQTLNADLAAHKSDVEIARKISSIEISERLTEAALRRLNERFTSDSQSAAALLLLADRSAFLDPPASDVPATPAPDAATQQHLLQSAQKFAIETLPRLPNLLATRTTFSFDDSPQEMTKGGYAQRLGLHLLGTSKAEVSAHNEREIRTESGSPQTQSGGLMTWGEFGSALLILLTDSAQGKTSWSHWEQSSSGPLAVFHYEVPKEASHYEIDTSVEEIQSNGESPRWAGVRARDAGSVSSWNRMIHTRPAYEGSLWIDPAKGTITRMTLVAELKGNPRFERAAILVEYGPVKIADQTLICPVRSLALSSAPPSVDAVMKGAATEWLNENLFTGYHLFASTSRIVSEQAAQTRPLVPPSSETAQRSPPAAEVPGTSAEATPTPSPQPLASSADTVSPEPAVPTSSAASPDNAPLPAPEPAASYPANDVAAGTGTAAATPSVTGAPTTAAEPRQPSPVAQPDIPPSRGYTLHVQVNAILVPVVVRDKQDHAISDLTERDFTVFDQGKPQPISGFTVVRSIVPGNVAPAASSQAGEAAVPTASQQNRFIVFLFDDRHLDSSDLARTQQAAMQVLNRPLASNEYAAVVSLMGGNSGITQDRAVLQDAVRKVSVHRSFQHDARDCPDIDYYSANKILNQHDETEFQAAVAKVDACTGTKDVVSGSSVGMGQIEAPTEADQRLALSAARHSLSVGEEDARESLKAVETVIHAMSKLTGQRTLILLSPGFLSLSPDAMNFKSQLFDQAAASNVVINVLDVRGLYAGNVEASQGGSQAFLSPSMDHFNAMQESENALSEMANGTGGTFFHNSNDLVGGLESLTAPPAFEYLLEISLKDVKPTGTYHPLQVKVDRPDVHVQARHGYFSPKEQHGKNGSRVIETQ